jgi:hypothetical protein
MQAIDRRHLLGDGSLARGCRSVYSDDHRHLGVMCVLAMFFGAIAGWRPIIARRRIKRRRERFRKREIAIRNSFD